MLKIFVKYAFIGGLNTAIHWLTFAAVYFSFGHDQMVSNFSGFCVAVTFSFFANAKWTYQADHTATKYFLYVGFMGSISLACGYFGNKVELNPVLTLIVFSAISLIVGFLYSTFIIFREE
ncbi:GtrA family protein [Rahnella sp. WP5]|uniref:GtrA family protein n=1 Tax=Rahnella sp. WP5 TaxID=1500266 RepID=UPI00055FBC84|nr:GtrA family protein [Rahnella sp. WP5]